MSGSRSLRTVESGSTGAQAATFPALLILNANFVLLWGAYGVSAVGDHLSELALLDKLGGLDRDNTTRLQALITFGFFFPFVVLGPIAGWWADRFSRKATMIGSDLLRAAVMASLPWTVPLLLAAGFGDFAAVLPLVLTGAFAAFFSPCRQALLPTLIRETQLVRANALISALGTIGTILSAVLGGWLVKTVGSFWNFQLDAMTFVLSALLIAGISLRRANIPPHKPLHGVWQPLREGFAYVLGHRRVLELILLGTAFWAASGVVISIVPALVRDVFGGDIADAGKYRGLLGIGLAAGAAVMTIVGPTLPLHIAVLGALAGAAFWTLLLGVVALLGWGAILSGVCLVMIGAHGAAILVTVMATLQRFVPDSRRGRVFGVSDTCTMAAMVLTTGLLGVPDIPGLDRYVPLLLALTGAGLVVALVLAWKKYRANVVHPVPLWIVWSLVRFYAKFWCRAKRVGPCTIPYEGPAIVAANHTAGIDPIMMIGLSPHRSIAFAVEQRYYYVPVANWFQRLVDCIPVNRQRPGKSFFAAVLRTLRSGGCLGIFPQGTFEEPGKPQPDVKPGIGMIALRSGAPVIPVHISGTDYHPNPFRAFFSRKHRVRVRFGKPVELSDLAERAHDKTAAQEASERIMQCIRALGPEPGAQDEDDRTDGAG